ncbi:hypothetical protein F5J12DRAFT_786986 [Pisolithus orientalis]|uniref:uncharacterized protein n=1 Tax=Pisolithus orientalis TaxID=936130 RepID=UPI0022259058|nr:uncharacterized protein F5J12DRAFT_786986 [Pisolithus orientalis]KAI5987915.1 hypothetical protein F5J12DRAFT_786986 [Pisolithus orientalis]
MELPHHYNKPIQAFTWREKVIQLVLHSKKEVEVEELLVQNLTMILTYMNRVFVQVVAEAKKHHEPAQVRNYRCNNDHNINCTSIAEVDWVLHEHSLGGMWYGSWTQFKMDENMKTVDVAWRLIYVIADFYDPVEDEDADFRYTYKEHLQGSAADKVKGKAQGEGDDSIGGGHHGGGWNIADLLVTRIIREEQIISFVVAVPVEWGYTSGPLPGVNLPVISNELGCSMY